MASGSPALRGVVRIKVKIAVVLASVTTLGGAKRHVFDLTSLKGDVMHWPLQTSARQRSWRYSSFVSNLLKNKVPDNLYQPDLV
jgi:hypothetical protein